VTRLADGCSTGSVIHELGHVIGLFHEHVREDRNQHVIVHTENILSTALNDFAQMITSTTDLGSYDFNSIMHYPTYAFSSNGQPTIETIPAGVPIGQRVGLSTGDVAGVRAMYGYTAPAPAPAPISSPTPTTTTSTTVTISANPPSEKIVVDGVAHTGSVSLTWNSGTTHSISAPNRGEVNGSIANFVRWSDGGGQTHNIVAGSNTFYKVDYAISYSLDANANYGGNVSISPASNSGFYPANSSVRLTATPSSGYCFSGWSGLIAGTAADTTVSMTKAYNVTAQFLPATYTLNTGAVFFDNDVTSGSVSVSTAAGCSWNVQSPVSWVTINAPASRTGSGTVTFNVAANNTGTTRLAMLTVAGQQFYVIQYKY
jgi:hypothetical protein